ncbi:hypothetical protein [Gallaecimonas sp. GXIMD4217]|uniref:hypothetical protein n=1 Tax=Gallaecimonas sp. GXIMD4217 TaxID=3131927 RepID=UPI00311B34BF
MVFWRSKKQPPKTAEHYYRQAHVALVGNDLEGVLKAFADGEADLKDDRQQLDTLAQYSAFKLYALLHLERIDELNQAMKVLSDDHAERPAIIRAVAKHCQYLNIGRLALYLSGDDRTLVATQCEEAQKANEAGLYFEFMDKFESLPPLATELLVDLHWPPTDSHYQLPLDDRLAFAIKELPEDNIYIELEYQGTLPATAEQPERPYRLTACLPGASNNGICDSGRLELELDDQRHSIEVDRSQISTDLTWSPYGIGFACDTLSLALRNCRLLAKEA